MGLYGMPPFYGEFYGLYWEIKALQKIALKTNLGLDIRFCFQTHFFVDKDSGGKNGLKTWI